MLEIGARGDKWAPVKRDARTMTVPWLELSVYTVNVALLALYGLTVSGHFPTALRAPQLKTWAGAAILWLTLTAACLAATMVAWVASAVLHWTAIVIAGGAMLLAAPLLLRLFPDRFVDGLGGLVAFAAGAVTAALILWVLR
jgi:hypothetical protein